MRTAVDIDSIKGVQLSGTAIMFISKNAEVYVTPWNFTDLLSAESTFAQICGKLEQVP